jgi:hypothetical protein
MGYLILLKDEAEYSNNLIKILISNIWHLHRPPTNVVSDQDRYFYESWVYIYNSLIMKKISMATYLETGRYTEKNKITRGLHQSAFRNLEDNK